MCVNFSSAQFHDPTLVGGVRETLADTRLPADRLVIELTETAFMRDLDAMAERMTDLNRLGVRLAVDDFGTGNASLRHLARFPVDVLKVDRSFVDKVGVDSRQTAIAGSIIRLGADLEMVVVAEGIERPEQIDRLLELGCRFGQGFYLARPAPAAEIEALLAGNPAPAPPAGGRPREPLTSR
jgi:EAL domain-containing protein (putative c-di-GMP-specific phosphodiesterase class I)